MIIGQGLEWPVVLNQSVAIGVVMFFGWIIIYVTRRTIGEKGIWTISNQISTESLAKNTETLIQLSECARNQQTACGKVEPALAELTSATAQLIQMHSDPESVFATVETNKKLSAVGEYTDHMYDKWGEIDPSQWRTEPVLDGLIHLVDTAEKIAAKTKCECGGELQMLRSKIADLRLKLKGD